MPYAKRKCAVCPKDFFPSHSSPDPEEHAKRMTLCLECRRAVSHPRSAVYEDYRSGGPPPVAEVHNASDGTALLPPFVQGVFDLETFGLWPNWGVVLCASILVHQGGEPQWYEFQLRDYPAWKEGRRSDDRALVTDIIARLETCDILYAHNGERFDVRWLRTTALRYELPFPERKLVDPAQVSWKKYRLGSNSLESMSDYLRIPHIKTHLNPDVWVKAALDADEPSWAEMIDHCHKDVLLLNEVAARVSRDVGMVDYRGSWR